MTWAYRGCDTDFRANKLVLTGRGHDEPAEWPYLVLHNPDLELGGFLPSMQVTPHFKKLACHFLTDERHIQSMYREPTSEFFNILRENNRNWTGRASIEIQIGLKLTKNLSDAHSVTDAINAYQEWLNEEIGVYAEDARRLMSHGQKFINASSRLLLNG
jgi:hypothetical protein